MSNRVSQQDILVVSDNPNTARVTQQSVKAVARDKPSTRATQQSIQALARDKPAARVSQDAIMVVSKTLAARSGLQKPQVITTAKTSPVPVPGDDYFDKVQLLLRSDMGLIDCSRYHRTLYGERRSGPFVQNVNTKFGSTVFRQTDASDVSFKLGGSMAPSTAWNLGTKRFTIELWYRPDLGGGANKGILGTYDINNAASRGWTLIDSGLRGLGFTFYDEAGNTHDVTDNVTGRLSASTWHHICVDRDDTGMIRLYDNGEMIASMSFPGKIRDATSPLFIMGWGNNASARCRAGFDDIRITKGIARYASNLGYTVPDAHPPFRGFESPIWEDDPYWNLCSLYLDAEGTTWHGDESPRAAPITISGGNTLPTWINGFTWYGTTGRFFNLADRSFEVADVDGQHNLGDGSPFTIQYIYQNNFSQGIVSYNSFRWEEILASWQSSGSHSIRRWNGTDYVSIGLTSNSHSYDQSNWVVITYDEHKTLRLYCNGYLVSKVYNMVFPSNADAKLFLGPSGAIRADDIVVHKGIAMFTDEYGIPAWYAARKPPKTGGTYTPPPPGDLELPYSMRPLKTALEVPPSTSEWVNVAGGVPGRTTKYEHQGGLVDAPEGLMVFNLNTTTRLWTAQTHNLPGYFDEIDAGQMQISVRMKYAIKLGSLAQGTYGVRFENSEGVVTHHVWAPNQTAQAWNDKDFTAPIPPGTRAVAIVFMTYNPETFPTTFFDEYELVLDEAAEPVWHMTNPSYPMVAGEWTVNEGGATSTQSIDWGVTGLTTTGLQSELAYTTDLPPALDADIDAGDVAFNLRWLLFAHSGDVNDSGRFWMEFTDDSNVLVGTRQYNRPDFAMATLGGSGGMFSRAVPAGARKVRYGYRGQISIAEGGVPSFYPIQFMGYCDKPTLMPVNDPIPAAGTDDPHWRHVQVLLSSRNGAVENIAKVPTQFTINGTISHATSPSKFGDAHVMEANTGGVARATDYLSGTPYINALCTAFTYEGWFRLSTNVPRTNLGFSNQLGAHSLNNSLGMSATTAVVADGNVPYQEWFHHALVRDGSGQMSLFVNGKKQLATAEVLTQWAATYELFRNGSNSSYNSWVGQFDEIRITDGVARYTDDFVPQSDRYHATDGYDYGDGRLEAMFLGGFASGTNTGSYSFANHPVGPASANRRILAAIMRTCTQTNNADPTGVTIGGVAATKLASVIHNFDATWGYNITWWVAAVPTGTTATIAPVWAAAGYRAGGMAMALNKAPTFHAHTKGSTGDSNHESTGTIDTKASGLLVAATLFGGGGISGNHMSLAFDHIRSDETAREVKLKRRDWWTGIVGKGYYTQEADGTANHNTLSLLSLAP